MRLWIDTAALGTAGQAVQANVGEMKDRVNQQVLSRGTRAVNQLRNAELEVLRGKGSGRTYRKYPYKSTYQASAPGEPPARRTGNLRLHWTISLWSLKVQSFMPVIWKTVQERWHEDHSRTGSHRKHCHRLKQSLMNHICRR